MNASPSKHIKILIVENNPQDVLLLQTIIKQTEVNSEIRVSESIEEAIQLTNSESFDCIFLDYFFPGKNGSDFLRYYSGSGKSGSVIMFTSQDDIHMAVECMKLGASDFLTKSQVTPASVSKSLRYVNRLKEAREANAKTEAALLESEFRLKNIIARSPILLFNIERDGTISMLKGKAASQLKVKPESVVGTNIRLHEGKLPVRTTDFEKACREIETHFSTEVNGRHFDLNYIPIRNEKKEITGMMGVAIDITSFKKNEEELINTIEIKEAASKIKEQFLANMSHEIRTPIHGIISLVQFVLNSQIDTEQRKNLELIKKSADTLLVIVNDILDLSKIDSGKMEFEEVPFPIRDTIQTTLAAFIPKSIEKNIELKTSIADNLPENLIGDPVRLTQILNNLLGNAIKFTDQGHVSIAASVKEKNEKFTVIQIEITDTGIGIPSHKIDTVFESFTQAGSDITRKFGGTGLGLTITKQLVEMMNGSIYAISEIDKGSTFNFCIPFQNCEKETKEKETKESTSAELPKGTRILVAEDHDINRFIIEKMLSGWDASIDFAVTGAEAVEKAKSQSYDIILMDIEMPDMNGYSATEIIRNQLSAPACHIPIIAMTGHAMLGEKEKCLSIGMNDYLSKPFKPEMLKEIIIEYTVGAKSKPTVNGTTEKNTEKKGSKHAKTSGSKKTRSEIPTEPIINLSFLRNISDNNEEFFSEFIELFLKNTPESIKDMQSAINTGDWEKLRQAAHKVKPSFNYVGLKDLNMLAAKIEDNAKQRKDMEMNREMLNQIREKCTQAYKELQQELTTNTQK